VSTVRTEVDLVKQFSFIDTDNLDKEIVTPVYSL
jgi:hypothetical protein